MEFIEETGATDTDWFCILGIFERLRIKYHYEWQSVKVDGIDEDAVEVIVHEIPKSNWGIGEVPASEKFKDIA